jgi:AraC-like DNA-binding protein/anti-anti-sigma regulatory factor
MSTPVEVRVRAERRGRISVAAVSGPLDMATSAELAEIIRAERAAHPARLVIDMSGVPAVDPAAARILAAAARPLPGLCPVIVRSLRPAARERLELAGLEIDAPPAGGAAPADPPSGGWDGLLADSATGLLIREWQHLHGSVEHAISDSRRAAQRLASTEDRLAATMLHLAARRPKASSRLTLLSQTAREYAARLRGQAPPSAATPAGRPYDAFSTLGRAVGFIEDRASDDISVADIAAAAFVTVRAVQLAFRAHLGTTPLTYLRQVRLERAHLQLLNAGPDRTTITAVAADWRFSNASRFTAYYRAAYGVPPALTLRQRPPD